MLKLKPLLLTSAILAALPGAGSNGGAGPRGRKQQR